MSTQRTYFMAASGAELGFLTTMLGRGQIFRRQSAVGHTRLVKLSLVQVCGR